MPYFLQGYAFNLAGGCFLIALHMYRVVSSIVKFLCACGGHKYFKVWEYVIKTEYQGRKTAHWHIAMWVTCHGILQNLAGRTNTGQVSPFVRFLQLVFRCDIDVQVGNGRLNYINGYISKDHDAVDVSLGEYTQKNVMSNWLATYRLLCQESPGIPECAIRMASLPEFDRSFLYELLYPPQPAAMVSFDGRRVNSHAKMYAKYLQDKRFGIAAGAPIDESFLVWHRARRYDTETGEVAYRCDRHNCISTRTMAIAVRYWYELTDGFWGQFSITHLPHQCAQDVLPREWQHLSTMQNFAGMLEYLRQWIWHADGIMKRLWLVAVTVVGGCGWWL